MSEVRGKSRLSAKRRKDYLFCALFLAYPVLQFVVTWAFVNVDSLMMAFQKIDLDGSVSWVGFQNFRRLIDNLVHSQDYLVGSMNKNVAELLNSFGYAIVTCFISLPLALGCSYFLNKKMPMANFFRVIFFLPNVIPVVALTLAFRLPFDPTGGYLSKLFQTFGVDNIYQTMFLGWPSAQLTVYLYCIWAGLGYNVILYSGAISRLPQELFESAQLDGAGSWQEFKSIVVPMVGPTTVTLVVLGMTNVLTLYLQPYLLMGENNPNIYTIAMSIFTSASGVNASPTQYPELAAKGLLFSLVWAPVVLLVRNRLSRRYADLDY